MQNWRQYVEIALSSFVIANPIGAIPIFISLTADHPEPARRRTAKITAATVAIVLVASVFLGQLLLNSFSVSIPSFRVGGGILILLMAVSMLEARPNRARSTPEETDEAAARDDIGVVPLGIPLVAGPGAISTMIIYGEQATDWIATGFLVLIGILVALSVWIALRLADPIRSLLGQTGINIVTRLLALILAAVAVEFITSGLPQLLPGLAAK